MSLGWMFYLADVSESLKIFFFLLAIVFFIICSFFVLNWEIVVERKWVKSFVFFGIGLILLIVTALLLPSKTTIYAFGAQYAIEDIATMPETKQVRETLTKFLEVVDSKLEEELKAK